MGRELTCGSGQGKNHRPNKKLPDLACLSCFIWQFLDLDQISQIKLKQADLRDHPCADGVVGAFVDDDECAGATVVGVGVGEERLRQFEAHAGDVVHG